MTDLATSLTPDTDAAQTLADWCARTLYSAKTSFDGERAIARRLGGQWEGGARDLRVLDAGTAGSPGARRRRLSGSAAPD